MKLTQDREFLFIVYWSPCRRWLISNKFSKPFLFGQVKDKKRNCQVFFTRKLDVMKKKAPVEFRGLKISNIIEVATMSKKDKNKNRKSQVFYYLQYYFCISRLRRVLHFTNRLKFKNNYNLTKIGVL